jgi:Flp pilus assembly protein TadD
VQKPNQKIGVKTPPPPISPEVPARSLMQGDPKVTAHDFFLRARAMEHEGNAAVALGYFRIAYEYDSESRDLCFILVDRLRHAGLVDTALSFGTRCLKLKGNAEAEEYKLMGELHLRRSELDLAVAMYEKALSLEEGDRDLLYTLATLYENLKLTDQQADVTAKLLPRLEYPQRLVEKQIETLRGLKRPDAIPALLNEAWNKTHTAWFGERLADWFEEGENYDSLLTVLRKLMRDEPDLLQYPIRHARALALAGSEDSAFSAYEGLVRKHPDEREVLFPYGALLFDRKRFTDAKQVFAKLVRQKPSQAIYQYFLGSAAWEAGDGNLALNALHKALDLEPRVPEYWSKLAAVKLKRNEGPQVDSLLSLLHSEDSLDLPNHFLRGAVYTLLVRRYDLPPGGLAKPGEGDTALTRRFRRESIEAYRDVLRIDHRNRRGLFEMAVGLERLGIRDSAISLLKTLVALDTTDATAANYLGYMLVEANTELEFAGRLIARALQQEPGNGAYLDSQGWWHYRLGQYGEALRSIKLALEKMPHDTTVLEHYALILERLGENAEAHRQWQEILRLDPNNTLATSKVH